MALRYDIKKVVEKPKGTRVLVPVIQPSLGFERSYLAEMNRLLQECAKAYRELIVPAYARERASVSDRALTLDVDASTFSGFTSLLRALSLTVARRVSELIGLEAKRPTEQWLKATKKAFGIDLKSVVQQEDLTAYLEAASLRNASLITGMTDDLTKRIAQDVLNAMIAGESVKELQGRVQKSFNMSGNRARLIARDQTSKLNSDLNKKRHQEAGIDSYIWRTSHDERVRTLHRSLDGRKYRYDEPTGAEEGLPPGQPIQCRCVAQAVVEF